MFSKRLLVRLHESCSAGNRISARFFTPASNAENAKTQDQKTYEKTINQVVLLGRVGNEPIKKGSQQHPVLVFSVATHNTYKYENGEFLEKTDWHRVCVFKPTLQELAFTYLRKGMRVHITGKITYGTVSDGEVSKAVTSVIADDIIFLHHDGNYNLYGMNRALMYLTDFPTENHSGIAVHINKWTPWNNAEQ